VAEFDEKPIAAGIVFPFGETVRIWKVGWSGEHAECSPNNVLYWEAIKWAKVHGYRYFDFVWIDLRCAEALIRGETIPSRTAEEAMSFFKIGFGGQAVLVPETCCKFYHPLARFFLRSGGRRLLASEMATRAASRLWNKAGRGGEG
jgi:hypothetical protein